jgi:hypothetical protein
MVVFLLKNNIVATWHRREKARWVAQVRDRIEQHEKGTPQFRLLLWRQTFDTPSYKKFFLPQMEKIYPYNLETTLGKAVDRMFSKSYVAILPEDAKAEVEKDVVSVIEKGEDKVWIDKQKGTFEYPYKSYIVIAHKK